MLHRFVIGLRRKGNFIMYQIGNEETLMTFYMLPNTTVSKKGIPFIPIKTTGCEKRCMAMLAVTADSHKQTATDSLSSSSKRKTMPELKLEGHIHIHNQEKTLMKDKDTMKVM